MYHSLRAFFAINWYKTLLFNFKKFPFSQAVKLPIYFYGRIKFQALVGEVEITAPLKCGMISVGKNYEKDTGRLHIAEIALYGKIVFHGYTQIGKDVFLYVRKGACCEFADMTGIASRSQLFCYRYISLGNYTRIGDHCKITDSDFHQMINTETGAKYPKVKPIKLGQHNFVGSGVHLAKGTQTPDYCTVAACSLCNKDYTRLGENILIGGIPAKLLKENITRDWEGEDQMMRALITH